MDESGVIVALLADGDDHRNTSLTCNKTLSRIALLVKYLLVLSDLEQSNIFRLEKITQSRAAPSCPAHIHPVVIN